MSSPPLKTNLKTTNAIFGNDNMKIKHVDEEKARCLYQGGVTETQITPTPTASGGPNLWGAHPPRQRWRLALSIFVTPPLIEAIGFLIELGVTVRNS